MAAAEDLKPQVLRIVQHLLQVARKGAVVSLDHGYTERSSESKVSRIHAMSRRNLSRRGTART